MSTSLLPWRPHCCAAYRRRRARSGVAVIDSGIAPLPAFNGRIIASYDLTTGVPIAVLPGDEYGHGTHVAGLIGANDANYMGVAPSVTFVSLKVLNKNGKGTTSSV